MTKEYKKIVMNEIDIYSSELSEWFKTLREICKWGLHKGKMGHIKWNVQRLRDLADSLEEYNDDSFDLSDVQDYHDWKNK